MAKIPVYQQQNVPNQATSITRLPADKTGEGLVSIAGSGMKLVSAIDQKQKEDAAFWVSENAPKFDSQLSVVLDQQKTNALPGAPDFRDNYLSEFDKWTATAIEAAPNAHAKRALTAHLAGTREAHSNNALQFQHVEDQRHKGDQYQKGVNTAAILVSADPNQFDRYMGLQMSTLEATAIQPEARAKLRDIARGTIAGAAVKGQIDQDPANWKGEGSAWNILTLPEREQALAYADKKNREFKIQKQASAFIGIAGNVMQKPPMLGQGMVDLPKAKALAQKQASSLNLDAEQTLALDSYMERAASDYERDYKRKVDASKANLFTQLEQTGGDYQALLVKNPWIQSMAPDFKDDVNKFAGMVATGETRATDWQVYSSLIDDPALLKATNLDAMRNKLGNTEYVQLVKLQKSLIDGAPEQDLIGDSTLIKQMLDEAGYKNNTEKEGQMFSLLQTAINQDLAVTGKKRLSQERVKELAADLMVKDITDRGIIWDTKQRGFLVEVPEDVRSRIENSLIQSGMPVNDYNVLQAYRNILRKQNDQ